MARLVTIPAPTRGWNTVDSIAEIPKDQAIVLDNMIIPHMQRLLVVEMSILYLN
jgi:hypothetical protein